MDPYVSLLSPIDDTYIGTVLEADYTVALQLLLKYPAPEPPHGPHTFVDDAVYLKDHLNFSGGANLILKYTGKAPSTPTLPGSFPSSVSTLGLRQRTLVARSSPLSSPARFIQNRESVEALFQGAAKGVIERGEKLGINQAVRGAMGEIRRNVQGFQEARNSLRASRDLLNESVSPRPSRTVAQVERRNRQLAGMLDEAVTSLRSIAAANPSDVADQTADTIEMVAAKVQLVKTYLEDPSHLFPEDELPFSSISTPTVAIDRTVVTMRTTAMSPTAESPRPSSSSVTSPPPAGRVLGSPVTASHSSPIVVDSQKLAESATDVVEDRMETDSPKPNPAPSPKPNTDLVARPPAPIPTRSTLAQSSFSWMLEPDQSPSTAPPSRPFHPRGAAATRAAGAHRKRPSGNAGRERNAFLFGEVTSDSDSGERPLTSDEIFGLEPLRKALPQAPPKRQPGSSGSTTSG